jgi:glycosyltransferase involved in cell wall biosynthesis
MPNNDARIRVLLVIAGLPAGGAERQMSLLVKGLDRTKFEVGLLIFNSAEKIHYRDALNSPLWFRALELSATRDKLTLIPKLVLGIRRAIIDFKPEIIHTTLNVANHAVRFAAHITRCKIPIITSVRVDFRAGYGRREKQMERLLWRRSNHIICNSETTRQQLTLDLGIPDHRISTIHNGIDDVFFSVDAERPAHWPKGRVALTVGRFSQQKNHLALVDAIAKLEKRRILADWSFVFLGEGPLQAEVLTHIDQHALQNRIHIVSTMQNMPSAYRNADLFILPSLFEGMSNALLEAAASRCPILVGHGADEAGIINNERGWIAGASLSDILETVLSLTEEERILKGQRAAAYIAQNFSVKKVVEKTVDVYRTTLN